MVCIDLCSKFRVYHKSLMEIGRGLKGLTVGVIGQSRRKRRGKLQVDKELKSKYDHCLELLI